MEFALVGALLTALVLAVMQLAFALHVRNTVLDAAAEGARHAALADADLADGAVRTRELIATAVGTGFVQEITGRHTEYAGIPAIEMHVRATLPLLGLLGPDGGLDLSGHAAVERDG